MSIKDNVVAQTGGLLGYLYFRLELPSDATA
jgi:hypothetical protein